MKIRIALAAVLLAASSFAVEMTRLQVIVKNLDGKPVEHAAVILKFVNSGKMKLGKSTTTWEARTNQDGIMKVPPMPQGKIQVQVNAKGYQTFGQIFQVDETDKTIEIKLNPPQQQYSSHQ